MGKHILLVEDEAVDLERLTQLLAKDGHTVVPVNNGAEALSVFRSRSFDLVITDFGLPFVSGNELAVRIKELLPTQLVLMISTSIQKIGPENPVDAFLHKGCSPSRLRQVVQQMLAAAEDLSTTFDAPEGAKGQELETA